MEGVCPAELNPFLWLWPWRLTQAVLAQSLVLCLVQYCLLGAITLYKHLTLNEAALFYPVEQER